MNVLSAVLWIFTCVTHDRTGHALLTGIKGRSSNGVCAGAKASVQLTTWKFKF